MSRKEKGKVCGKSTAGLLRGERPVGTHSKCWVEVAQHVQGAGRVRGVGRVRSGERRESAKHMPTIVPVTTVPFLREMVTVSPGRRIKKRTSFIAAHGSRKEGFLLTNFFLSFRSFFYLRTPPVCNERVQSAQADAECTTGDGVHEPWQMA